MLAWCPTLRHTSRVLRPDGEGRHDRVFMSCGVYDELIVPNRSMVHVFENAGMQVRYTEARDGHSWKNWRDRLRDALSWVCPGPQKVYDE